MINVRLINMSNDDSFLVQCFKNYCCKTDTIDNNAYENNIKDLNDYKTVAAICYLLISDEKWKHALNNLKEGLSRISKKDIKSSTLIYDELALVSIAVAIKEHAIADYYQWLRNVIFELESYCISSSKDTGFIKILEAYFDDQLYPTDVQFKDKIFMIWLTTFSKEEKNNTYKQQAELIQKAWKCEGYLFDDILYNGLCSFLIDLLIKDKFEFGLISVEQKYQNAVNRCKVATKRATIVLIIMLILLTVGLTGFLLYLELKYEALSGNTLWYVPAILQIITLLGIAYGIILKAKSFYGYLNSKIFDFLLKLRGLD